MRTNLRRYDSRNRGCVIPAAKTLTTHELMDELGERGESCVVFLDGVVDEQTPQAFTSGNPMALIGMLTTLPGVIVHEIRQTL